MWERYGLDYSSSRVASPQMVYAFTRLKWTSYEITREWWRSKKNPYLSTVVFWRRSMHPSKPYVSVGFWLNVLPELRAIEIAGGRYWDCEERTAPSSSRLKQVQLPWTYQLLLRWYFSASPTVGSPTGETETEFSVRVNGGP